MNIDRYNYYNSIKNDEFKVYMYKYFKDKTLL